MAGLDVKSFLMGKKSAGGGTTNYDSLSNKPSINGTKLTGDKSAADLGLVPASVLQLSVYQYFISSSGYIRVHSNCGVIDNIKVPTSYAGQTLFVTRVAPVWITNDNAISKIYDPAPQIQSAVVASDGSISTKVNLLNNNYIIVVTTTNLAAALADKEISVSFTPMLFSCRYTRRTNEFLDGIELLAVNEREYLQMLGYQLVYEEIVDSPDNEFLNMNHAVFMFDGTNYYAVQTKPSTISQSATFYTAKYQRLSE